MKKFSLFHSSFFTLDFFTQFIFVLFPEIPLAQQILLACKAKGIRHIVLSPGSRNAPLTIGFASDAFFTTYSMVDERCAAFFALGLAQQLREPVVVACTSGSALLNYYPAVSEAFYSNIPLVVISADRPASKIDIGDGQTIHQPHALAAHTAYNANLSEENKALSFNEYLLNEALNTAALKLLPVHINAPFEEPLYRTLPAPTVTFHNEIGIKKQIPLNCEKLLQFTKDWIYPKKMVLIGVLPPGTMAQKWIDWLQKDPSILVLTESTANVVAESFVGMIDTFLSPIQKRNLQELLQPDVLISIGGMVVSKKIKEFLRQYPPRAHYYIDEQVGYDTFFALTHHFKTDINTFLEAVTPELPLVSFDYKGVWLPIYKETLAKRSAFLAQIPFSDMAVYQAILEQIPTPYHIQISNSAPIRYVQLFPAKNGWEIFCNRGTSGIDGSTSTAIGASVVQSLPTLLITGDLSFFYNSNALWCNYIPKTLEIIIVNNGGGGIFRILPTDKETPFFETFQETTHSLTAEHLCHMYGITYLQAENKESLTEGLKILFSDHENPILLEVFTPRMLNDTILKDYFNTLS